MAASIPFVGFGILDNAIMIFFGDIIDMTLCVKMGFSTMAAAALGNTLSDAAGVYSGAMVESLAAKYGFESPSLSRAQEQMPVTKKYTQLGQVIGIVTGCLIGMFPLLLIDPYKSERIRREQALDNMFSTVIDHVADLLGAELAMLMFVDDATNELYTRSKTVTEEANEDGASAALQPQRELQDFRAKIGSDSVMGMVAKTGRFINIEDMPTTEYYRAEHDNYRQTGVRVKSVLCMPIMGYDPKSDARRVVGVLEVINKKDGEQRFTNKDEDVLAALCSHISTGIGASQGLEQGFRHTLENCEATLNMRGTRLNAAQNRREDIMYEQVMRDVTKTLRASATQLMVLDPKAEELVTKVSDRVPHHRNAAQKGIMGKVAANKQTIMVNNMKSSLYFDPDRHLNYQGSGLNISAVLAAPCLSSQGEVLGVIEVFKAEGGGDVFTADDCRFLNSVASTLALNLEGSGASLQRVLSQMKQQHKRELAEQTQIDCSQEVLDILHGAMRLVEKSGAQVNRNMVQSETTVRLDAFDARRK
jgi:GAF domain-containing protein